jgi:hypothetical protein
MLVQPKHLEWNFKKRDEVKQNLADSVRKGELSAEDAKAIFDATDFGPFIETVADRCYFCGDNLLMPAVMWHGHQCTGSGSLEIWMHPKCVEGFMHRLMRDANEADHGKDAANGTLKIWKNKNPTG